MLPPLRLLFLCGDVIRPGGAGWLLRCSPTPRNLAAERGRTRDTAAFAELAALSPSGSVCSFARLAALDKITGSRPGYFKDANGAAPGGRLHLALDSFTAASM
jgi:hypothetical protein